MKFILILCLIPAYLLLLVFLLVYRADANKRDAEHLKVVALLPGQRLIDVRWQDNDLWYLTEDMDSTYAPKYKYFESEYSGIKIQFQERK